MPSWEDVLDDLVRHRGGALVRYAALLTGERREAEDLVQDALVRCFGQGRPLRDAVAAEAYVRRAILTIFLDATRRRQRWSGVAHLLAEAVEDLFPGVKFWVGHPSTAVGSIMTWTWADDRSPRTICASWKPR